MSTKRNLLILSIATLLAGSAHAQNIPLENAGFENDWENWRRVERFGAQVSIGTEAAHGGGKSLRINATTQNNNPFVVRRVVGVEAGAIYKLSAWARAVKAVANLEAAVKIEFYNAQGKNTSGFYGRTSLAKNEDWQPVSVTAQADTDTTTATVYLRVYGAGDAYFDDIAWDKVKSAPHMRIENSRLAAPPDKSIQADFRIWMRQPIPVGTVPPIAFRVGGVAQPVTAQVTRLDEHFVQAKATLPALSTGDYTLNAESGALSTQDAARIFVTMKNRRPRNLTADGTLLVNGKPFFPIGMYHPYKREEDYKLLAESGFNAVQGTPTHNLDELGADLDRAQRYGIMVDVPFYGGALVKKNLEYSLAKINRFKNHPAVLNWKIIDEPDIQSNTTTADEVPEAYRVLKAADNVHPLELTMAHDETLSYWSNFCDIVQIDRYPVPQRPLTDVYDFSVNAIKAKQPWQNMTYVLQCGWTMDMRTQPTVPQARSMAYLALIAGAKGIFWYSMRETEWDLTKTPFWPEMKAINAEISALSQPIMLGREVRLQNSNAKVYVTARRHANKLYVLVTNPETTPQNTSITLPAGRWQNGKYLAAHRDAGSGTVPLNNRALTLNLAATDSRTLVFDAS